MKKQNKFMRIVEKGVKLYDEHQREIMLGAAIAGTVVTAVLSWKAGIKASKVVEEQRQKMDDLKDRYDADEEMTDEEFAEEKKDITIETIKRMAPVVGLPVLAGTTTIIAVVCGYKAASTQIATLSTLYSLSDKALSDQIDKTKELFGDKKAREVKDAINTDKVLKNPPGKNEVIVTGRGETLCYDDYSGRYFKSDAESIRKAVNDINAQLRDDYFVSLNEFYNLLGLSNVKLGEDIGFAVEDSYLNLSFSATLTDNNIPCLVLNYDVSPKYGFGDMAGRFGR